MAFKPILSSIPRLAGRGFLSPALAVCVYASVHAGAGVFVQGPTNMRCVIKAAARRRRETHDMPHGDRLEAAVASRK